MRTLSDFLAHFRRQRRWTRELVAAIPEDRFDWAPAAESFSCGDLVRHLIQAEVFWVRLLTRAAAGEPYDPFDLPPQPEERMRAFRAPNLEASHAERLGTTPEACLERWSAVQARSEVELAAIPEAALERPARHPLTGFEGPLWEFFLVMLEHEAHHRGQLSAYLKALGVAQPLTLWM